MKYPLGRYVGSATILDYVALTVSPKKVDGMTNNDLFLFHLNRMAKIQSPFLLYPELDKTGRLHYHGKLFKTLAMGEDIEIFKTIGFICIKEPKIDRYEFGRVDGWERYCLKSWKSSKKLFKLKNPINNEYCKGVRDVSKSKDILSYFESVTT